MWKYEKQFRAEKPETINESDRHFDLDNYKDWLEEKLSNLVDLLIESESTFVCSDSIDRDLKNRSQKLTHFLS